MAQWETWKLLMRILVLASCIQYSTESVSLSFDYTGMILPWEFRNRCTLLGGQVILNDTCYYNALSPLPYEAAEVYCAADDAYLLSVATVEEKEHLTTYGFLGADTWLGLNSLVNDELSWTDGFSSILDSDVMTVSDYNPSVENCSLYSGGLLTSANCLQPHQVVCKLKHFFKCYPGWAYEEQTDKCYRIFGTSSDPVTSVLEPKNVDDAKAVCKKYPEGHLVSSFAGSFFVSWHPFWSFLGSDFEAWIGAYYNNLSPTGFVDDDGAILSLEVGWLSDKDQVDRYNCTYYNKTAAGSILQTRLYPGEGDDCYTVVRPFMCEIGAHDAIYPGQPEVEEPQVDNNNNTKVRTQLFELAEDRRLVDKWLTNVTAHSRTECAMYCMSHNSCLSFNFYFRPEEGSLHLCELNTEAVDNEALTPFAGYFYGWKITQIYRK
ncbi:uncharacterized protein LOC135469164 [Liolophura sinensis]|uniref:uncharacterized protein LOC135469164 n=1 Tax=Liolophura sinensis TaxID=3198878 RepID=UPI0031594F31